MTSQEEPSSSWLSHSVVLTTSVPLTYILGDQHLGGLVHMADHHGDGGGALRADQGRCYGQNQGGKQKQGLDLHDYLLGDRTGRDPDHFLS